MNNIYKVIWSKAKNCYVVASEIARSHTKSATGSEKIGGVTKRSLLASLMALSLLCGGLGVAEATVHVNEVPGGTSTVYTTDETYSRELADAKLALKADATDVATNIANIAKNADNITKLENNKADKTALGEYAKTADVNTELANKADKADVYSKTVADGKFATNDALNDLKDTVNGKADKTYVDQKLIEAGNNVDTKLAIYATKTEVDGKITAEENARNTAINTAIIKEQDARNTAITTAINGEVTARKQAIDTAIEQEKTNRDAAITNAKLELQGKITAEETARTAKDLELEREITKNSENIATLDKSSVKYDNPVAKDTITLAGPDGTKITHLKDATLSDSSNDAVTGKQLYQTNERTKGIKRKTEGTKTTTTIEDNVTVDNSGNVGGVKKLSAETITTGNANIGALNVTGETTLNDKLTAKGEAKFEKKVTMEDELDVSDTDGNNKANLSVKAGEGVKASATDGTTTGSLDVKADGIVSSVKDADGKGSTFKQRIDAIMMESKDVSIKAEGTLTNEAKDIVTNASNSITEKVGENNVTTKTTTSSKSEIQNADTITSVQQTENMVQSFVGKKDFSTTNVTTNLVNASANAVTEDGQTSTVLNNKDGLLIRNTANVNSFTTVDRTTTGAAREWTNIKGNEISTGKVEADYVKMGYADVMHDLGVRGNAKIDGKTTTGSLEVTGTSTLKGNVTMESDATVKKNLTVNGITTTKTLKVTENAEIDGNAIIKGDVTARSYKVGGKTYISAAGINANNQKITNVADGSISEGSKDAVNGGQLYTVKNDLEGKVNKVGANAAAMANLHPMEFDPDSKWNIAAAIGNYGSETAAALGAFYRPNDDVMVNLSTAFGTGENMVGGGVSVRLGKSGNKLSREESNALKAQVDDLTARMDALLSVLNSNMSKDFPDVPENHWAYEAVSRLAGNDIVQGYPDGEFHGERTMTRYEMAEIIYNALSRGAEAEKELVEEFKPELQAMAASEKATAERAEG